MDSQQLAERIGRIVKKVDKTTIVTVLVSFVSIWVVLAAGMTAVWLTEELRVFGLVLFPTAVVAALLVLYFDWRARLLNRVRNERNDYRDAA
jgi:hypothetical protein